MILECILFGIILGIGLREASLIYKWGLSYEEKLRIYDRERKER